MFTGDIYSNQKWRNYYECDVKSNPVLVPKYGLFGKNTVVGVLLDMDRGAINFYKDGNDLG